MKLIAINYDDDDMLPEQEKYFVQTDAKYGITLKDALKCVEILNANEKEESKSK